MQPSIYKPSIYNGNGVYKNGASGGGGGGGGGTFVINGQTLFFPPWLQPVECLDLSNYTGNDMAIRGEYQFQLNESQIWKIVFRINQNSWSGDVYMFQSGTVLGGAYPNITLRVTDNKRTGVFYGNRRWYYFDTTTLNWADKITFIFDNVSNKAYATDEHGNSLSMNGSGSVGSSLLGNWSFCHENDSMGSPPNRSKLFYSYITEGTDIKKLWVPARRKDNTHGAYMVECIQGIVGVNWSNVTTTEGIAFGPDVTFEDIAAYFTS